MLAVFLCCMLYSSPLGNPSVRPAAASPKPKLAASICCRCWSFLYFSRTKRADTSGVKYSVTAERVEDGNCKKSR